MSLSSIFRDGVTKALAGIVTAAVMAFAGFVGWAFNAYVVPLADVPMAIADLHARLDTIERQQKLPLEVVRLRAGSGAPPDGCVEGELCRIRVVLSRRVAALSCQIVPGETEWYFTDSTDMIRYSATPANARRARNLSETARAFDWQVPIPTGITPPSAWQFCFTSAYTGCPGQREGGGVYRPSEPICVDDVLIVAAGGARP